MGHEKTREAYLPLPGDTIGPFFVSGLIQVGAKLNSSPSPPRYLEPLRGTVKKGRIRG